MKLYQIAFDSINYFVEASSFGEAIAAWKAHVKQDWGDSYTGIEEPDSVALIYDEPVIRGRS